MHCSKFNFVYAKMLFIHDLRGRTLGHFAHTFPSNNDFCILSFIIECPKYCVFLIFMFFSSDRPFSFTRFNTSSFVVLLVCEILSIFRYIHISKLFIFLHVSALSLQVPLAHKCVDKTIHSYCIYVLLALIVY